VGHAELDVADAQGGAVVQVLVVEGDAGRLVDVDRRLGGAARSRLPEM